MAHAHIDLISENTRPQRWQEVFLPEGIYDDPEQMLFKANELLAEERLHGIDHERKGLVHLTAALVRTKGGHFYIKPNLHLANTPTSRNCGELLAITDAIRAEGPDAEITDLWFMAARADINAPGRKNIKTPIIGEDKGLHCLPCGSCLASIGDYRLNRTPKNDGQGETQIHSLPANLGNDTLRGGKLLPFQGDPNVLQENEVLTKSISELLPNIPLTKPDPQATLKTIVKNGWDILKHNTTQQALNLALQADSLVKLKAMNGQSEHDIKKAVNDAMVDAMQGLVGRSSTEPENARVVVVRTEDGDFFMGSSIASRMASGMQFAEHDAIDDVIKFTKTGTRITDIFIYAVDFDKVKQTTKEWKQDPAAPVSIDVPDGSILRRISALSPNGDQARTDLAGNTIDKTTGANVHFIVPNNKEHFDQDTHIVSTTLSEILRERWESPTMKNLLNHERRNGYSHGVSMNGPASTIKPDLSDDYIVFVPTSTPEKVALYQHAADAAGWPIQFRKMQDLVEAFHIVDEPEGDYVQNAEDKLREAEKIIHDFNNGKSQQLINLCEKKWGIRFQKDHILFATDDSGMDGPPGVWEKTDQSGVSKETLEKIEHYLAGDNHKEGFPRGGAGTELVPVVSGMLGQTEYVKRMTHTIMNDPGLNPEITGKDLRFVEHCTLTARKLSNTENEQPISFVTPLLFQFPPRPDTDIKTSWHYLRPEHVKADRPQDAGKTAAEIGLDYVGHYSPRRQIVDHLATKVLGLTEKDKRPRKNLTPPDQPFHVTCVDFDAAGLSENTFGTSYHFSQKQGVKESAAAALGEVENLMKSGDAFVLKADHGLEDVDRFRKFYTLFSMAVAKLLNGRDMNKPIIIQNHVQDGKGCWDDAIAMHDYLVKRGMTKDFAFTPSRAGLAEDSHTQLTTNGYFDAVRGRDLDAINERTQALLDWHRAHYEKRDPVNSEPKSTPAEGEKPPEDLYKVAVFLSASSESL